MKTKSTALEALMAITLSACNSLGGQQQTVHRHDAHIEVDTIVDMGDFHAPYYKKFVNISFRNTGTDTLHIMACIPDCDCTKIELADTIVLPDRVGNLRAYLDLSDPYPPEVSKRFFIMSDDPDREVVYITLIGHKK